MRERERETSIQSDLPTLEGHKMEGKDEEEDEEEEDNPCTKAGGEGGDGVYQWRQSYSVGSSVVALLLIGNPNVVRD